MPPWRLVYLIEQLWCSMLLAVSHLEASVLDVAGVRFGQSWRRGGGGGNNQEVHKGVSW